MGAELHPRSGEEVKVEIPSVFIAPTKIVVDVPFNDEPKVSDNGGLTSYLVEAILHRVAMQHATVWELETEEEDAD